MENNPYKRGKSCEKFAISQSSWTHQVWPQFPDRPHAWRRLQSSRGGDAEGFPEAYLCPRSEHNTVTPWTHLPLSTGRQRLLEAQLLTGSLNWHQTETHKQLVIHDMINTLCLWLAGESTHWCSKSQTYAWICFTRIRMWRLLLVEMYLYWYFSNRSI